MKRRGGQEKRGVSASTLARDNGVKLKHRQGMDWERGRGRGTFRGEVGETNTAGLVAAAQEWGAQPFPGRLLNCE